MRNTEYTANLQLQTTIATPAKAIAPLGKCGNKAYPLGEQIASTVAVHGLAWAAAWYAGRGVPLQEFVLLARGAGALN